MAQAEPVQIAPAPRTDDPVVFVNLAEQFFMEGVHGGFPGHGSW